MVDYAVQLTLETRTLRFVKESTGHQRATGCVLKPVYNRALEESATELETSLGRAVLLHGGAFNASLPWPHHHCLSSFRRSQLVKVIQSASLRELIPYHSGPQWLLFHGNSAWSWEKILQKNLYLISFLKLGSYLVWKSNPWSCETKQAGNKPIRPIGGWEVETATDNFQWHGCGLGLRLDTRAVPHNSTESVLGTATAITTLHLSSQLAAVRHPTKDREGRKLDHFWTLFP